MLARSTRTRRRTSKGFTLVEMLTVVLIIAILMDTALPLYLSVVQDSKRKTCRTNMETIASAVQAARVKTMAINYSAIITAGVTTANLADLPSVPACPGAGTYTLTAGTGGVTSFKVNCNAV